MPEQNKELFKRYFEREENLPYWVHLSSVLLFGAFSSIVLMAAYRLVEVLQFAWWLWSNG